MKALLFSLLFLSGVFFLATQAATAQNIPTLKTYTHVTSEGCVLKYVETADESGKIVEGKPQSRHSSYSFTIDLAQTTGPAKDPLTRGQKSDHLHYSVPLAFQSDQSITQEISVNGGETASALLKHTTASFEVEGKERALKLEGALNAAIQACAAK